MKQIHECTDGRGCKHINQNILNWRSNEKICRQGHAIMILGRAEPIGCTNYCEEEKPKELSLKERIDREVLAHFVYQKYVEPIKKLLRDVVWYSYYFNHENPDLKIKEGCGHINKELGIE